MVEYQVLSDNMDGDASNTPERFESHLARFFPPPSGYAPWRAVQKCACWMTSRTSGPPRTWPQ